MITNLNLEMLLMTIWMLLMRILVRCVYMMLRMYFILLRTMLRCKSCLKTIETNKAKSKNATQDKVEDFNGLDYIRSEQSACAAPGC